MGVSMSDDDRVDGPSFGPIDEQLRADLISKLQMHGLYFWYSLASLVSPFGHCECGRRPLLRNIGSQHFMCCDVCQTYWHEATDSIPGWEQQEKADSERNRELLRWYRRI